MYMLRKCFISVTVLKYECRVLVYMHITLYKCVYSLLVIRLVPLHVHHHIHDISISDVSGRHKILHWWEGMRSEYESTRWLSVLKH